MSRGACATRTLSRALRLATSDGVPLRALVVALVVGTVLNLINQGDVFLRGGDLHSGKLILTYLVPYAVSTHGAVTARLRLSA